MDGALDFLWLQAARKLFAFGTFDVGQFEQFLSRHEHFFAGRNFVLPTFLDNHDMNRYLWVSRGDKRKLRQAAVCQFTLSAPPIVYYGTEIGLSQLRDVRQAQFGILEESRLPMPWDERQDRDLYAFYQTLIAFRKKSSALKVGGRTPLIVDPGTGRYGYLRSDFLESVIALFNVAPVGQRFDLPAGVWHDVFSGGTVSGSVTLEPFGFLLAQG
jgi:glycosidase